MLTFREVSRFNTFNEGAEVHFECKVAAISYSKRDKAICLQVVTEAGTPFELQYKLKPEYANHVLDAFRKASKDNWVVQEFNEDVLKEVLEDGIGAFPL